MTSLEEQMTGSTYSVLPSRYLVFRLQPDAFIAADTLALCFAVFRDPGDGEITVIAREGFEHLFQIDSAKPIHKWYRIIRFNLLVPFEGVGFIAAISRAVADQGVNILAASAYSYDYLLVNDDDLTKARQGLDKIGLNGILIPGEG